MVESRRTIDHEVVVWPAHNLVEHAESINRRAATLSDLEIQYQMSIGNLVIFPYNPDQTQSSSYDVRLGEYFYREHKPEAGRVIYSPWSESDVRRVWRDPQQAALASDRFTQNGEPLPGGVLPNDRIILLSPGERILGHTNEFIGGRRNITTSMRARSSMNRNFVTVCDCAGWGDVGYFSRWTMEIKNHSTYQTIVLVVGRRVAQITFEWTGPTAQNYTTIGKYQTGEELADLVANWNPENMLPQMWKDREIQPGYVSPKPVIIQREKPFTQKVFEAFGDQYADDTWIAIIEDTMQVVYAGIECKDFQTIAAENGIEERRMRYLHIGTLRKYIQSHSF
jgi:dCTP deaminase